MVLFTLINPLFGLLINDCFETFQQRKENLIVSFVNKSKERVVLKTIHQLLGLSLGSRDFYG